MLGNFFSIHDIATEQDAVDAAQSLCNDALEAVNAGRGRMRKMRTAQRNLDILIGKCHMEQWAAPLQRLSQVFKILESESARDIANMFSISNNSSN